MSTGTIPVLPGLWIEYDKAPIFATRRPTSISGKETRIRDQAYPRYQWTQAYNALRQGPSQTEQSQLQGFFETLGGGWDSFLFTDPDDSSVTSQGIGTGAEQHGEQAESDLLGGRNFPA